MKTWEQLIADIDAGQPAALPQNQRWKFWKDRKPVIVLGASGAGKTELHRQMTGSVIPDRASADLDKGYMSRSRNGAMALITIPGQVSTERARYMREIFGPRTAIEGVIFVATYGFDEIWPLSANDVAANLRAPTLAELRNRNIRREIDSFRELCESIGNKQQLDSPSYCPKWLLIAVAKADLYWNERDHAFDYYRPYSGSMFDETYQRLRHRLGENHPILYKVAPVAFRSREYKFTSDLGTISESTKLNDQQCQRSTFELMNVLEEISVQPA